MLNTACPPVVATVMMLPKLPLDTGMLGDAMMELRGWAVVSVLTTPVVFITGAPSDRCRMLGPLA